MDGRVLRRGGHDVEDYAVARLGLDELDRAFELAATRPPGFLKAVVLP